MKKNYLLAAIFFLASIMLISCDEEENPVFSNLKDVKLTVKFNSAKNKSLYKKDMAMTKETPENYFIALKSATLIGSEGTSDFELFNKNDLSSSFVFDFTDDDIKKSLFEGDEIPEGTYNSIKLEIYYLQMNIAISTIDRGIERRNFRIYLSDDAETEGGLNQPGDMTQINDNVEIGWLLGEGQSPNMDPVTPRIAAYTHNGDGVSWYDFAGKSAQHYGPFGDVGFMNNAPHPIYNVTTSFSFDGSSGEALIVEFNVEDCWQFEDKDLDGAFGAGDLDPVNPTKWQMNLPAVTISFE